MDLRTVLTTDTVNLHLKGTTKEQIVDEMIDVLFKAGKVTDKNAARECVLDRERKMSTGMKHGIAIPHGKTDTVNLHLKGTTKEEIVDEMLDVLYKAGKVSDKAAARECVLDRERKMSTGMKHGIAIPHGKTDTVTDLVACIGISDNPVDFDSLDQEPCRIFIMTLSPINKTGPHLQFLAEVSLLFKSPEKRQEILDTQDKAEVIRILTE